VQRRTGTTTTSATSDPIQRAYSTPSAASNRPPRQFPSFRKRTPVPSSSASTSSTSASSSTQPQREHSFPLPESSSSAARRRSSTVGSSPAEVNVATPSHLQQPQQPCQQPARSSARQKPTAAQAKPKPKPVARSISAPASPLLSRRSLTGWTSGYFGRARNLFWGVFKMEYCYQDAFDTTGKAKFS
jgi:hypothetical protein